MGYLLMLVVALGVMAWSFAHRPDDTPPMPVVIESAIESAIVDDVDPVEDEFEAMCAAMENCR